MKVLIFDTGALITLSLNGLLYLIEELKKDFDGEFIIPHAVKYEIIDKPLTIPRFELGALRVKDLLERKIINLPEDININHQEVEDETNRMLKEANSFVSIDDKLIEIVSAAEISCLALSKILKGKNIDSMIVIDERTTRVLVEKPENIQEIISNRFHKHAKISKEKLTLFENTKIIRSTELAYVAYKKGLTRLKGPKALEAILYATKFKGAAVSFEEINEIKKM
jgi:hypothetical protein